MLNFSTIRLIVRVASQKNLTGVASTPLQGRGLKYVVSLHPKLFEVEKRGIRSHLRWEVIIGQCPRITFDDLRRWRLIFRRVDTFYSLISIMLSYPFASLYSKLSIGTGLQYEWQVSWFVLITITLNARDTVVYKYCRTVRTKRLHISIKWF